MKKTLIFAASVGAMACGTAAQAECIVTDPSPTPLNVRTAPYGRIIGALANGQPVSLIDASADLQGSPWVYVADEAVNPLAGSIGGSSSARDNASNTASITD